MKIRYTSKRSIATLDKRYYYGFSGTASYFRSAYSFIDRSTYNTFSFEFKVSRSTLSPRRGQRLLYVPSFVSIFAYTTGKIYIYRHADAAGTVHNIPFDFDQVNSLSFFCSATGKYSITCNGLKETGEFTNHSAASAYFQIGDHTGTDTVNGVVFNVGITSNFEEVAFYPLDDNDSTAYNSLGNVLHLTLTEDGSPNGWVENQYTHVANRQYTQTIKLRDLNRSREANRNDVMSISGVQQSTYAGGRAKWNATTVPMVGEEVTIFREFLDSCEDGSKFEIDIGDGIWRQACLAGDSYSEQRSVRRGNGGQNDYHTLGFSFYEA